MIQSINKSIIQTIIQSIIQSIIKSINQSIIQWDKLNLNQFIINIITKNIAQMWGALADLRVKGTVSVTLSEPSCKNTNARYTMVPLKP